jgi:MoxR-like ATPase
LEFKPGSILSAIDAKKWVIVDELNRADIDKAIGQLFTTLSGHVVVLPFEEDVDGAHLPVAIVPAEAEAPDEVSPHRIPPQWRMLATLNTRDRDLLFALSYALMRRFAVIDVGVPARDEFIEILKAKGDTNSPEGNARVHALLDLPHRVLGPAILLDVAAYVRERLVVSAPDIDTAIAEALVAFVLPQLDDLTRRQQVDVAAFAQAHLVKGWPAARVRELLADAFHTPAADLATEDEALVVTTDGGGLD